MLFNGNTIRQEQQPQRLQLLVRIVFCTLLVAITSSSISSIATVAGVPSSNVVAAASSGDVSTVTAAQLSTFANNDPYRWREQLIAKQQETGDRQLNVESRTVLVIRIDTGSSDDNLIQEHEINNVLFYESTQITVQKQMQLCSGGRIQLQPAGTVTVSVNLGSTQINEWTEAIAEKVMKDHFRSSDTLTGYKEQLRRQADHVLIILPHSKFSNHNFVANAEIGRSICVFHPLWVLSISAYMHEMGHNMDLRHSGRGSSEPYADTTGYMGVSKPNAYVPQKCYNAAQQWALNFYDTKRVSLVGMDLSNPVAIQVAAFVDHEKINTNYAVIVQVGTNTYLQFNRAKSYNVGTDMMIDQIVVISDGGDKTVLIAGMDSNSNALRLSSATIEVCSINIDYNNENNIDYAVIAVGSSNNNGNMCDGMQLTTAAAAVAAPPTASPVVAPTNVPIIAPTNVPTKLSTAVPTVTPTSLPTVTPTFLPTVTPTSLPTVQPTTTPTATPVVATVPVPVVAAATPTSTPTTFQPTTYTPTSQPTSLLIATEEPTTVADRDEPFVWLPVHMTSSTVNGDVTEGGSDGGEIVRTKASSSSGGILSNKAVLIPCILVLVGIALVAMLVIIRKRAIHEHYAVSRSADDDDYDANDDHSVFSLKYCDKNSKTCKSAKNIDSDTKSVRTDQMSNSSSTFLEDLEASTNGFVANVQNLLRGEYEFDFGER